MQGINAGSGWCEEYQCYHFQYCDHGNEYRNNEFKIDYNMLNLELFLHNI